MTGLRIPILGGHCEHKLSNKPCCTLYAQQINTLYLIATTTVVAASVAAFIIIIIVIIIFTYQVDSQETRQRVLTSSYGKQ